MSNRRKTRIVVHCSDTPASMDIGAAEITRWHTDPPPRGNGWRAIGYAAVIRRDGTLELGRDIDGDGDVIEEIGAHAAGFNAESIGVCLVGGKGGPDFTPEQLKTLRWWIGEVESLPQTDIKDVCGHRDLPGVNKACPSFNVRHWLKTGEIIV